MQDMIDYMYGVAEEIYKIKLHAFEAGDEAVALQIGRGNDLISVLSEITSIMVIPDIATEFWDSNLSSEGEHESL